MRNRDRDRDRDDDRGRGGDFRRPDGSRDGGGPRRFERGGPRRFERGEGRPFEDRREGRPYRGRGERPFEPRRDRPYEPREPGQPPERREPRDGDEHGIDRPRRQFDRGQPQFDRGQRPFDRGQRPFDRGQRPFDRSQRPFDRSGRPPQRPTPARAADGSTFAPGELIGETETVIAGRRPVSEAFAARRDARRLLVVPDRRAALESLVLHATTLRLPIIEVEGGTLTSLTGFDGHQGVALVVAERAPATVEDMLTRAATRGEAPFVLILDSLEDPQNLGTLLRSAEACGVHGVIYPTRHAAPLTAAAVKASAGASEHLLLAAVDNLPGTLADLRSAGLRLMGADEGAALRYSEADMRGPLALVVGSEERGISGALRRRLDMTVRIPMRGRVASLNAAVAGSVLLFAAAEQRGMPETGDRPPQEPDAAQHEVAAVDAPSEGEPAHAQATDVEATETHQPDDEPATEAAPEAPALDQAGAAEDDLLPGEEPR